MIDYAAVAPKNRPSLHDEVTASLLSFQVTVEGQRSLRRMTQVTSQDAFVLPMLCATGGRYCEMVRCWSAELADVYQSPLGQCERAYTCRSHSSYLCIYTQGKTRLIAGTRRRLQPSIVTSPSLVQVNQQSLSSYAQQARLSLQAFHDRYGLGHVSVAWSRSAWARWEFPSNRDHLENERNREDD